MGNAAHVRERLIKFDVRRRIARRAELAFHHFAFKVNDDHIVRRHIVIRNAAGFDDDQSAFAVDLADVAPSEEHEFIFNEVEVCLQNFFFQLFQHSFYLL